jgi:hypothetical protein
MEGVGTLAALDFAAAHGLVDLQTMFDRLRATTFRSPLRPMGPIAVKQNLGTIRGR